MAEYIEREALIKKLNEAPAYFDSGDIRYGIDIATQQVIEQPTADVVEVVRCKDCEHCCISTDPKTNISIQKCGYVGFNPIQSSQVSDDFYCGFGELKEREG